MRKCDYFGNPWIGMFVKTNDEFTVLPVDSLKKLEDAAKLLETEVVKISVGESNLIGVYTAMNSSGVILPNVTLKSELDKFKKLGINVYMSREKHNAHGNNIAVNDKAGIINGNVSSAERKKMEDALGVELVPMRIAGYSTVGSACIATNKGFLAHYRASEDELGKIGKILKVNGERGTVNMGVGFVSYGAIANNKSFIAGEATSAFELGRVMEALGFVE